MNYNFYLILINVIIVMNVIIVIILMNYNFFI